jgi:hypothetical protein
MKDAEKGDSIRSENEFQPNEDQWTKEVRLIMQAANEDDSFVKIVMNKVRELVPYSIAFTNEKRRPNFRKEYQEEWARVEQVFIVTMLYHSNSLEETKKFLGLLSPQKQSSS